MKIAICDDNKEHTCSLATCVYSYYRENLLPNPIIKCFDSGDAIISSNDCFDLVFLDVEMPGQNGISVGNYIISNNKNAIIVMVTSHMEYLDDAMRFNVFRYLSKPLDTKRLFRCLDDAIRAYNLRQTKLLSIENNLKTIVISSDDIIFIETFGRKIIIHTQFEDLEVTGTINSWIKKLPAESFCLCHRCYLVNLAYVSEINREKITLSHGKYVIYISQRKVNEFKKQLMCYLEYAK